MGHNDHRWRIFDEIDEERIRQDTKWGELNHPDVDTVLTDRDGGCTTQRMAEEYGIPTATCARANCDGEAKLGRCTWAHIAVEELAEAVEAATDAQQGRAPVASLRKELVQLTAVLVAWVEAIDRRPKDGSRMRNMVSAVEVAGSSSSWLVTLDCGHKVATRERRVMYPCRNCAAPKGGA